MPSKFREKVYLSESYHHIFNRGVDGRTIFEDADDYAVFLNLLKRYLSDEPAFDSSGRPYDSLYGKLELLAFCLMPNHFHLLIYQSAATAMTQLLRCVCTAYTQYFNMKHKRFGPLFQDRFKASMITQDGYLQHISRYIHLNPVDYQSWQFSSYQYYLGQKHASWVRPERLLAVFEGGSYQTFVADYEDQKRLLKQIKQELADF